MTFRIGYLVHDLNDAAVAKRCAMMVRGGAEVCLAGFRRAEPPTAVEGITPTDLGETADGALAQRALAVLRNVALPEAARRAMDGADILIARNLESLAIAQRIAGGRPVVYECLDIHRSLLDQGIAGRTIRKIEAELLARTAAIITSSPGFIREYFDHRPTGDAEVRLIENKILLAPGETSDAIQPLPKQQGPPWVIGWFGMLRCERTLRELLQLADATGGAVQIRIAGKPSSAELQDFEAQIAASPYCHYSGPYKPAELPELYSACHFAWAIDWFEEGQNSEWLLPNRLYEATAHATVPIVLKRHEVGRWLAKRNAGLQIVTTSELTQFFGKLTQAGYTGLQAPVSGIERQAIMMGDAECHELTAWLKGLT
ncbi:hypothetical protein [Altererythrobacter sp. GH1-8]|uniref:hypothetical protein n=1 Tax=Altererythrobacter sp. GH1-8 TaxID=3349333 RepID=UPI00374D984A